MTHWCKEIKKVGFFFWKPRKKPHPLTKVKNNHHCLHSDQYHKLKGKGSINFNDNLLTFSTFRAMGYLSHFCTRGLRVLFAVPFKVTLELLFCTKTSSTQLVFSEKVSSTQVNYFLHLYKTTWFLHLGLLIKRLWRISLLSIINVETKVGSTDRALPLS